GIGATIIGYLFSSKISISSHDIFLGFLAGFFALGDSDNTGIHIAAGISLGVLSTILFYKHSNHPTRFALYGAGVDGVAAEVLSLLSQL
ncbi:MAG: hypothetical protein QF879_16300, partial [Candidatus Latescibacteria bacterium]|nr:hypothetical protein [Candidatus Latescibacterota bacterium]